MGKDPEEERLFVAFDDAYQSDSYDQSSWAGLKTAYDSKPELRNGIDHAFITACGYSYKTISAGKKNPGKIYEKFTEEYASDQGDMGSWRHLLNLYRTSPKDREGINRAMITLCGWSLPTLCENAGIRKPAQDPTEQKRSRRMAQRTRRSKASNQMGGLR